MTGHPTRKAYKSGCRCVPCMGKLESLHGTVSGYDWGCKCELCKEAAATKRRTYYAEHRERLLVRQRQWREANPDYQRGWREANPGHWRNRRYGLTDGEFAERLAAQRGGCAICGGCPEGRDSWHVDHDHACCPGKRACGKCVRGILCGACNRGIGQFRDDPARLSAAAAYLVRGVR